MAGMNRSVNPSGFRDESKTNLICSVNQCGGNSVRADGVDNKPFPFRVIPVHSNFVGNKLLGYLEGFKGIGSAEMVNM